MNKTLSIIGVVAILITASMDVDAQDAPLPESKFIFDNQTELKGFGSLEFKMGDIIDDTGLIIGASAGITVNKYLLLGLGGYGIATNTNIISVDQSSNLNVHGGYGGLILGVNLFPRNVVHLSFPVLLGMGNLDIDDESFFGNQIDSTITIENSTFFIAEPTALIEINVTKFFHLGLGASYRFVDGLSLENLSGDSLTGWSGTLGLKFGSF